MGKALSKCVDVCRSDSPPPSNVSSRPPADTGDYDGAAISFANSDLFKTNGGVTHRRVLSASSRASKTHEPDLEALKRSRAVLDEYFMADTEEDGSVTTSEDDDGNKRKFNKGAGV